MGTLTVEMQQAVETHLGFVATVCRDGTPNLSPKGTTAVWDDDHLVFAHIRSPRTVENLSSNPSVEINVVDPLTRTGFRFKGHAAVHTEGSFFGRGVAFYESRGMPAARSRIRAIVIVAVERALAVTSPAYDLGATESSLRAIWLERLTADTPGAVDATVRRLDRSSPEDVEDASAHEHDPERPDEDDRRLPAVT